MNSVKYPSTPHLPFSPGAQRDDSLLKSVSHLMGKEVVASIKKDGESTALYRTHFHARSLDGRHHPSRDWVAAFRARIAHKIPEGWRICGENLFARHSIAYENLPSYFMGFSAWTPENVALSWDDTVALFEQIGIEPVEVVWRGIFDEAALKKLAKNWDCSVEEGFVVRLADGFKYEDFDKSVAKWVRAGHVQTNKHWMAQRVIPNGLAGV